MKCCVSVRKTSLPALRRIVQEEEMSEEMIYLRKGFVKIVFPSCRFNMHEQAGGLVFGAPSHIQKGGCGSESTPILLC